MNDSDNNKTAPDGDLDSGLSRPAFFLHASGTAEAGESWVSDLQALGLDLFSHRAHPGCHPMDSSVRELPSLAAEWVRQRPGQPLILLRAPLRPPAPPSRCPLSASFS